MTPTRVQTNVRLPELLRQRLAESADRGSRSLAAEIVARLEASFAQEGAGVAPEAPEPPPSSGGPRRA